MQKFIDLTGEAVHEAKLISMNQLEAKKLMFEFAANEHKMDNRKLETSERVVFDYR